jgi:hypothetical protein
MLHSKFKKILKLFVRLFIISLFFMAAITPIITLAQASTNNNYVPLAPINGYVNNGGTSLSDYLNNMFRLGIGVAIGLAVIMIIWGGVQLVSTDSITGQLQGRDKITSALWGLVLALAAWVILQTINPQLLNTNLQIGSGSGTTQSSQ